MVIACLAHIQELYKLFSSRAYSSRSANLPLSQNEIFRDIKKFETRLSSVNWINFYKNNPFDQSCQAIFTWAPVADELKQYDEEIVLNSMALKWNNIVSDFKKLINY